MTRDAFANTRPSDPIDSRRSAVNSGAYAGASYVTFFGLHLRGREVIEESHRLLFDGPLKGSRLTGDTGGEMSVQVRFPHPDVAVTVATGGSTLQGEDAPDPAAGSGGPAEAGNAG
ncbi:hypothetical protein ABZV93_13900 [Actinopolymorpha sp. NPDC004070]|uniref:hypothetical protein n=1 Tax=Actinopolymorpha sp. NPDC004070 TaxID=3154548 RepID=UPI0033B91C1E